MSEGRAPLFAIVDCAADRRLYRWVTALPHDCLFAGRIDPGLAGASPYIVQVPQGCDLADAWSTEGRGKAWGIFCRSRHNREELRRHFRRFLRVTLPNESIVMFRFYDPRVLTTYWPTCTQEEKSLWLAAVEELIVEDETGAFRDLIRAA